MTRRSGKSFVMEKWVAAAVRAGQRVTILRQGGRTVIVPLKRPQGVGRETISAAMGDLAGEA